MATPEDPDKRGPDDPAGPKSQPNAEGWIDKLARRSTGLPSDHPESHRPQPDDSGLWKFAGLGLQFAGSVAILALIGIAIDHKMGWSPWALISCTIIAVIGNLYLLIKESLKEDKPGKPPMK